MGFHKRYIDDNQVIELFRNEGCQAVIDLYSKGVDAILTTGELSSKVNSLIQNVDASNVEGYNKISITIARASYKKRMEN